MTDLVIPKRVKDLTGQVFGRLTVVSFAGVRSGFSLWNVVCTCGKTKVVRGPSLSSKNTTSCGCYKKEKITGDGFSSARSAYRGYKLRAKKRNFTFALTFDEFYQLSQQNCSYCGIEPRQVYKQPSCTNTLIYNGIDRVDNLRGYEPGNCVPCCGTCNKAKLDTSVTEFKEWINRVYIYQILPDK